MIITQRRAWEVVVGGCGPLCRGCPTNALAHPQLEPLCPPEGATETNTVRLPSILGILLEGLRLAFLSNPFCCQFSCFVAAGWWLLWVLSTGSFRGSSFDPSASRDCFFAFLYIFTWFVLYFVLIWYKMLEPGAMPACKPDAVGSRPMSISFCLWFVRFLGWFSAREILRGV